MSLVIKFYFTSSMLNMFRTLIHPSSGACDFSIVPFIETIFFYVAINYGFDIVVMSYITQGTNLHKLELQ